jgi:thioredoxin-like negative regulator of GroEL
LGSASDVQLGLLHLREAVRSAQLRQAPEQCRTRLALAVALLHAGRSHDAYLEALLALARARQSSDTAGERASAKLLGQLTRSAGYEQAAAAWDVQAS